MAGFPIRRRNDVTTVPGFVPLGEPAQAAPPPEVAPQTAATLPPAPPDMRDFRVMRRQQGMLGRANVGFANRISNINAVDPLAADLASGGDVGRSNYNASLPQIEMTKAWAPVGAEYWRGQGIANVAAINAQGRVDAADVNGQWRSDAAEIAGQSRERIADITGQSRESAARISGDARVQAAGTMRPLDPSEVRLNDARAQNNQSMAKVFDSRAADMGTGPVASPAMLPPSALGPANATQPITPGNTLPPPPASQPATQPQAGKPLDEATARQFLQQAGGDANRARQMAREAGYTF